MRRHNTNSPIAAALAFAGLAVACLVGSWLGAGLYAAGFLIGGIGTAVNAMRERRAGGAA